MAKRNGGNSLGSSYSNTKATPWSHHIVNRKRISSNSNAEAIYAKDNLCHGSSDGKASENDCDNDKKYPDLLEISSMMIQATSTSATPPAATTASAQFYTQNSSTNKSTASNPFCTLPRKKHGINRHFNKPTPSESQSPLLNESSSRYGSSTFADSDLLGRRLSSESFTNYPLSIYSRNNQSNGGRSNSFLNLTAQPSGKTQSNSYQPKRNPSLPSSPCKEQPKLFSPAETPLLDFSSLAMHKQQMIATPSSSSSNATANASAYDYHAAQLERFLEEYRNLQEQLCKMKETCDSIRKKEAPLRGTAGNSVKLADPVMFTAAALGSASGSNFSEPSANPKGILKHKVLLPGQPPDPPPYWLHRNAMLKRLQDPSADFFPS